MIWEGEEVKKIDLTVLDVGWTIIHKVNTSLWLGLSPIDTGRSNGPLMLRNCFFDFAVEHWFSCCATEPGFNKKGMAFTRVYSISIFFFQVDKLPENSNYLFLGMAFSIMNMMLPLAFRAYHGSDTLFKLDLSTLGGTLQGLFIVIGGNWRYV